MRKAEVSMKVDKLDPRSNYQRCDPVFWVSTMSADIISTFSQNSASNIFIGYGEDIFSVILCKQVFQNYMQFVLLYLTQ